MSGAFEYIGGELALFQRAVNWKRYWRQRIQPYVSGNVLEVGAGIGANTKLLAELAHESWTSLEPDPTLASKIQLLGKAHAIRVGTTQDLRPQEQFDSILYIDVLEHIEEDRAELARAAAHLSPGGYLIVLSPAHQFLFTPFDKAIGHYRRYSLTTLAAAAPPSLRKVQFEYVDSVGMLASGANRLLLSQSMPTERQILTWDRLMVPLSRMLDPLLAHRVGKSVICVWSK